MEIKVISRASFDFLTNEFTFGLHWNFNCKLLSCQNWFKGLRIVSPSFNRVLLDFQLKKAAQLALKMLITKAFVILFGWPKILKRMFSFLFLFGYSWLLFGIWEGTEARLGFPSFYSHTHSHTHTHTHSVRDQPLEILPFFLPTLLLLFWAKSLVMETPQYQLVLEQFEMLYFFERKCSLRISYRTGLVN